MGEFTAIKKSPTFNVYAYEVHEDDNSEPPVVPIPSEPVVQLTATASMVSSANVSTNGTDEAAQAANQDAVIISRNGNNIVINGDLDDLVATESSEGMGTHKWIAVDIATNLDSIVGATWNGSALTNKDVADAAANQLGAGHIVYWADAEALATQSRTITIAKDGYESVTLTVSFEDTEG